MASKEISRAGNRFLAESRSIAQRLVVSKEISRLVKVPLCALIISCSTPCGINGNFTIIAACAFAFAFSAQRLSASMEISPIRSPLATSAASGCSTPLGINGNFTHILGDNTNLKLCAQRLSASMEISPFNFRPVFRITEKVLNASRHQWKFHELI